MASQLCLLNVTSNLPLAFFPCPLMVSDLLGFPFEGTICYDQELLKGCSFSYLALEYFCTFLERCFHVTSGINSIACYLSNDF